MVPPETPGTTSAALATLQEITETALMAETLEKEVLIREMLVHPLISEIRGKGLMLALMTPSEDIATSIILKAQEKGLILFWLLFEKRAVRLTPPLTISLEELRKGCGIILDILQELESTTGI